MLAGRSTTYTSSAAILVATLAAWFTFPADGLAATRFAAPNGSGIACSAEQPCDIQTAAEAATALPRDTVILGPGRYQLGGDPLVLKDEMHLRGEKGASRAVLVSDVSTPGEAAVTLSYLPTPKQGSFVSVEDVIIEQRGSSPGLRMVDAAYADRVEVHAPSGVACRLEGFTIVYNTICSGVIGMETFDRADLDHVTAVGAEYGIDATGLSGPDEVTSVSGVQSIFYGGRADVRVTSYGESVVAVGSRQSNYDSAELVGDGSYAPQDASSPVQSTPPAFVNAAERNYRQASTSPTIDAGFDHFLLGPTDFEGDGRIQGGAPDIGADEAPSQASGTDPDLADSAPETLITRAPPPLVRASRVRYRFDAAGNTAGFECKLDRQRFSECKSPWLLKDLENGRHRFQVRAVTEAGAADRTPARDRFRVQRHD